MFYQIEMGKEMQTAIHPRAYNNKYVIIYAKRIFSQIELMKTKGKTKQNSYNIQSSF